MLVIHAARLSPEGTGRFDVEISAGRITNIRPAGMSAARPADAEVINARGRLVTHGIHDAHIHLFATARARASVSCGPPDVRSPEELAGALAEALPDSRGWVRGVGYSDEVAGELDAGSLDTLRRDVPIKLQHSSGALWVLNSAALDALQLENLDHPGIERHPLTGRATGRLWRADDLLHSSDPGALPELAVIGTELARFGVTHLTDATPELSDAAETALLTAAARKHLPQHLQLLGAKGAAPGVPWKIVIADSRESDFDFTALCSRISDAHRQDRPVAVHAVSRESLALLLASLRHTGTIPGDRVEHASLVDPAWFAPLRDLGLRVVTQPGFIEARGDGYLARLDKRDLPDLYRVRSLLEAGVDVRLSSDSPYGPMNPWAVIRAATQRRTQQGTILSPGERVGPWQALAMMQGGPAGRGAGCLHPLLPGQPADLMIMDPDIVAPGIDAGASPVQATVISGRTVWQSGDDTAPPPSR